MPRLGSPALNATFNPGALPDTQGNGGVVGVEMLSADPTLKAGQPRVWFNTTTNLLKVSDDGATTYVVGPAST